MGRGLLSRLAEGDTAPVDVERSIIENVRMILNTRIGSAPASPDFGLVDITDMIHAFPEAIQSLRREIRDTLLRSEPRLQHVSIRQVESDDPLTFRFEISARLADSPRAPRLRLRTDVSSRGIKVQ